jgi:hypothetical protein
VVPVVQAAASQVTAEQEALAVSAVQVALVAAVSMDALVTRWRWVARALMAVLVVTVVPGVMVVRVVQRVAGAWPERPVMAAEAGLVVRVATQVTVVSVGRAASSKPVVPEVLVAIRGGSARAVLVGFRVVSVAAVAPSVPPELLVVGAMVVLVGLAGTATIRTWWAATVV